jgi:hypothetical protein
MDLVISIENFEESSGTYRDINSPRTLESCLRCGLDPAELYPKSRSFFVSKELTKEMVDIKRETFEKKRYGSFITFINIFKCYLIFFFFVKIKFNW